MKLNLFQKKVVAFTFLIACINLFMGCHRYFRPVRLEASNTENKQVTLKKLSLEDKYFILRKGEHNYALTNIIVDPGKMSLTANIGDVPPEHQMYLKQTGTPPYKYSKARSQDIVLREVHLYTGDTTRVDSSTLYTLSFSDVQKIEILEIDRRKTTNSYVWGAVGITLGVALVAIIIAAATYSKPQRTNTDTTSCPFISTFDGKEYKLQGEIYSAAIYPSLQKDDYLPLQLEPVAGDYRIKISNELKEIQHTDFAELMVVEHDKNVKILVDPGGKIYSISQPQLPLKAMLNDRIDVREEIINKDNKSCIFKDDHGNRSAEDLYMTFRNDGRSPKGKLVIRAKTSSWLSYLFTEFTKGFGSYYEKWEREQERKPASELEKWTEEQNIPLTVSVKTVNGWKEIKKINAIGPLLYRDMVIPVELTGGETAEFKISGGYMFWDLDYAAIDYTPDGDFVVQTIKPYEAINEHGGSELANLLEADKKYLDQPDFGDSTILKFKSIAGKEGMAQTCFLYSSGYYKHIRNYTGTPKVAFLKSFSQPGIFPVFSRQKFAELWDNTATAKN